MLAFSNNLCNVTDMYSMCKLLVLKQVYVCEFNHFELTVCVIVVFLVRWDPLG